MNIYARNSNFKSSGMVDSDGIHPPEERRRTEDLRHGVLFVPHVTTSRH